MGADAGITIMTGAERQMHLMRLVGLFGEIEATARRARQTAEANARTPMVVLPISYQVECIAILKTLDRVKEVLSDL